MAKKAVSANGLTVLNFLKANKDTLYTAEDLGKELNMDAKQINGIVTAGLIGTREPKKDLVERKPSNLQLEDGTFKTVKVIVLTDKGLAYNHAEAVAADAAAALADAQ